MSRLENLELDFQPQVIALIEAANKATGRQWGIVSGRRTMLEQRALYAQGRTSPGKVVTRAKAGASPHNFGLAVDLCPYTKDGKDFDWNTPKDTFKVMADVALGMGLTAGFYFRTIFDPCHVESPKWRESQALWMAGKLHVA